MLLASGRREEALAEFRRSLAVYEKLAAIDPGNRQWQRELSLSHDRVGDTLAALAQRQEALAAYRRSLAIREKLVAADAANAQWQLDLSISHEKIANTLDGLDRKEEALGEFRRSLAILERLVGTDPRNTEWQRDVSIVHIRMGDVLAALARPAEALAQYRQSLAIREKLAIDAGNARAQADLVINLYKISTVAEPRLARAALRLAVEIADALARGNKLAPAQREWPELLRAALAELPPEQSGSQ